MLLSVLSSACGTPSLDLPAGPPPAELRFRLEPERPLDAATPVFRMYVEGASQAARAGGWLLFSGELSAYHVGRIKRRDYPKTLLARQVPAQVWQDQERVVIAPSIALEPGSSYSLASEVSGLAAVIHIGWEELPSLTRRWPPLTAGAEVEGARLWVYCDAGTNGLGQSLEPRELSLDPLGVAATLSAGVDGSGREGERCLHIAPQSPPEGALLLPPPAIEGALLDPAPIRVVAPRALEPLACEPHEALVGLACVAAEDDRIVVRPPAEPLLWSFEIDGRPEVRVSNAAPFVVRGLTSASRVSIAGSIYDSTGSEQRFESWIETLPQRAHLVLNEVLSNPVGPEPQQEWVELVNDSREVASLSGLVLEDVGGSSALPDVELEPFEHALLVGPAFDPLLGFDVAPASGTRLIRLAALGKSGIANGGEPLRLRDATGAVLSSFPALPAETPGVSLARVAPEALDGDPASFAVSAAPGASPGEPNRVLEP